MQTLHRLLALAAVSATAAASSHAGTFANITPDGDLSDWNDVPVISLSFNNVTGGNLDIIEVKLANNGTNLFALITFATPVNPNNPDGSTNGPTLYFGIDRDQDAGGITGYQPFNDHPGIEAAWRNDTGLDTLNGPTLSTVYNAAISPFGVTTATQEISVSLSTLLTDNSAVFGGAGSTFRFLLYTRSNNYSGGSAIPDVYDELVVGTYSIAASPIPEPSAYAAVAGLGVLALAARRRRR